MAPAFPWERERDAVELLSDGNVVKNVLSEQGELAYLVAWSSSGFQLREHMNCSRIPLFCTAALALP